MKVNLVDKEVMEEAHSPTRYTNGTNATDEEENRNCKAHLRALQAEFENMEESLRNMLRHKGPTSDNEKDDTRRQMHSYKNAIAKFRNHINIVERENYALKRQMTEMTSQSSHNTPEDAGRQKMSGNPDKSQLDDIRDTCLVLSDRIKRMEEQNNQLLLNAEKQRSDYERCLDRVANQFVQALFSQQRLQMECDKLRRQLYEVTGNKATLAPGSPVRNVEGSIEPVSPLNGYPSSGDSVSDDAFVSSPTYPRSAPPCLGPWNPITNIDGFGLFSPIHSAPQCGINRDENFNFNPSVVDGFQSNVQMLKKYFRATPDHVGRILCTMHQMSSPEYDKNTCRSQSSKLSPLKSIPEASETCLHGNDQSGSFRPRLTRCGSEILGSVSSAGDIFSSVPCDEDMSRSRERQRTSKPRSKVARSRSFDNNSYVRNDDIRRHGDENRANMLRSYRPGPPLNCLPTDRSHTQGPEETNGRHLKLIQEDTTKTNNCPSLRRDSNVQHKTSPTPRRQLAEEINCLNTPGTSLQPEESREETDGRFSQRSRSQAARTVMGSNLCEVGSGGFPRNAFQRSFRVTKSSERDREHFPVADDVWLPRMTSSRSRPSLGSQNVGSGRKKSSHSKICSDLPPPPPPPPIEEDEYQDVRSHSKKEIEDPQHGSKRHKDVDEDVKPKTRRNPDQTSSSDLSKKQALAKRESYTAACRKSQSLDHLYEMIEEEGKMELTSKSSLILKECQSNILSSSFSTFDIHGKGIKCPSAQGLSSSTLPSCEHLANQTKTSSSNNAEPIPQEPQTLNSPESTRRNIEEDTAGKTSVSGKSQLQPPRSRLLKKGSKSETSLVKQTPRPTYVTKATVDLSPNTSELNQLKSGRLQSPDRSNQSQLPAANSYEILPTAKSSAQEQKRRASEGAVRNISGKAKKKSRIAAPSYKQSQLSKSETILPDEEKGAQSSDPVETNEVTDAITSLSTYNVNNLTGNKPGLTSKSFSDLTSKTSDETSMPISSTSHTNLTGLTKPKMSELSVGNRDRLQYPERRYEHNQSSTDTSNNEGQIKNQPNAKSGSNRPKPDLTYTRSQSVELKPKSSKLSHRGVLQNRSVSSERNVKSAASDVNNRTRQRQKTDCDVTTKSNGGKKKGGHPRSFVDIMKSKFGGKNSNSQSKKVLDKTQENENIQSVIDPRTLSLEPKSTPPGSTYGKGSKGSKKKLEDSNVHDPVGKKLSQPFLNKAPLESLAEIGSVRSDVGKRSFLSRQNSKRNAARLARLTNNERMNNSQFGRVELIPVGSRVSLSAISNPEAISNNNICTGPDYGTYSDNRDLALHGGCNVNGESCLGGPEDGRHLGMQELRMNRKRNDYENVVLQCDRQLQGQQQTTEPMHTYENVVIVDSSPCHGRYDNCKPCQTGHSDHTCLEDCPDRLNNNIPISNEEYFTVHDMHKPENHSVENLKSPKSSKLSGTAFSRIWGSISSHSLNKDSDSNSGSKNTLHQIGGGRGVSGDGKKAAIYANEQKRFESAFISSVVSSELAQKANDTDRHETTTTNQYENVHVVNSNLTSSNVAKQTSSCARLIEDYCLSQTEESGKSSMSCSTTGSSKSATSSFDSWPSNNGDADKRNPGKRAGSLDACYRNMKTLEEMNCVAGKDYHQSPHKIGSRSSLGSFGYGSGVSSTSASSCSHNSSSLRDRSIGEQNRGRSVVKDIQSPRDSSSDADMAPSKPPRPAPNRFTSCRSLSPLASNTNGSKLQKPSRLARLNASNRGRIKMGVSSISTESCIQENNNKNKSQPPDGAIPLKLAPLSYGLNPGQMQIPRSGSALRSGQPNDSRRLGIPYSPSAHATSRLPSHTAIKYIPAKQQHV